MHRTLQEFDNLDLLADDGLERGTRLFWAMASAWRVTWFPLRL